MSDDAAALKLVEERLARGIGLDVHSLGSSLIGLAVRTRMKQRGIASPAAYLPLLDLEAEWQALVEEIIVPETWFFRDRQPFLALAQWTVREWLPAHPFGVMRLISAPCSTGEEPYSIVMALLEAGAPPERFTVEAVDISETALAKARLGLYSRNSFRGPAQDYRENYFTRTAQGWQLADAVKSQVRFRHVNVLDPSFARKDSQFDAVFCRNMMIYFDAPSRARLMERLHEMLAGDGRLFLGHAEGGIARGFGFEPLPLSMSFAFRKAAPGIVRPPSQPAAVAKAAVPKRVAPPLVPRLVPRPAPKTAAPRPAAPPAGPRPAPASVTPQSLLAQAQQLADAGSLAAAREHCQAALRLEESSVRAHYLLGLISDAGGNPDEAEAFYHKTLYLEPKHYEALLQLALLAEKRGDLKAARRFRQRAQRAGPQAAVHPVP